MFPNSMTATIAITDSRKTRTLTAPETANKPIFIAGSSGNNALSTQRRLATMNYIRIKKNQ